MTIRRFLLTAVIALVPISAHADDFSDYRIPAHRLVDWRAGLSSIGNRSNYDGSYSSESKSVDGAASSSYSWLSDSDPATTAFDARVQFRGSGNWNSQENLLGPGMEQAIDGRMGNESWFLGLSHRRYPWETPVGFFASVSGGGAYRQQWLHQSSSDSGISSNSSAEQWVYEHQLTAEVGVGLGRVRDATGVYEAQILEERLSERGALTAPLSAATRQRLVALLSMRVDYSTVHERDAKYLWNRIEEILDGDSAFKKEGLDAYALLRAGEPHNRGGVDEDVVPSSPVARTAGAIVEALYSTQHSRFLFRNDFSSGGGPAFHSEQERPFDTGSAGGQVEYHRPAGPHWQVDLVARGLVPFHGDLEGSTVSSHGALTFLIADRWTAGAFFDQNRTIVKEKNNNLFGVAVIDQDGWSWSYGLQATYYFEDRMGFTAAVREDQSHSTGTFLIPTGSRSGGFQVGLTYRIQGRLDTRGLFGVEDIAGPR